MTTHSSEPLVPFEASVRRFLLQHGLLPENGLSPSFEEWAVGISGGGDSIFLLHLLLIHRPSSVRIRLLHFDHHTEEQKNLSDRNFLSETAKRLDLPLLVGESPSKEKSRPSASETLLRQERQAFFEQYLNSHRRSALFLGHQADDRIETVLANLFQGGGPRSLIGIAQTTANRIFRPMLGFRRDDIRQALDRAGIPYSNDPSNQDPAHLRNRVRHQLRPFLDRFFPPEGTRHLEHLALLMEKEIQPIPQDRPSILCEEETRGRIRFSLFLYRSLKPSAQGLFIRWLMDRQAAHGLPVPLERNLLRTLEEIGEQGEKRPFPLGHGWDIYVVLGRADLVYQYSESLSLGIPVPDQEGKTALLPLSRGGILSVLRLSAKKMDPSVIGRHPGMSCFLGISDRSGERKGHPRITYWTPGLSILQKKGDEKLLRVSSLWKNRKIPEVCRQRWPVLCRGEFAVWMPGLLDRTSLPDPENDPENYDAICLLTYQERERSEWKKFLGNP